MQVNIVLLPCKNREYRAWVLVIIINLWKSTLNLGEL